MVLGAVKTLANLLLPSSLSPTIGTALGWGKSLLGVESLFFGSEEKWLLAISADELFGLIAACFRHRGLPVFGSDTGIPAAPPHR